MNWVKTALVVFPAGLILTGVVSMFWYVSQKKETAARSIRYAAGLAREINAGDLERHLRILNETSDAQVIVSFLESTLGPENMGYTVRKVMGEGDSASRIVVLDVELTGQQRPRDVVLVLTDAKSSAAVLSVAHAMTGEPQTRSIRFAIAEDVAAVRRYYTDAVSLQDRISHVLLLGAFASEKEEVILEALHLKQSGAVVEKPDVTQASVESAQALRQRLKDLASRL